jgi:hypothetical protein
MPRKDPTHTHTHTHTHNELGQVSFRELNQSWVQMEFRLNSVYQKTFIPNLSPASCKGAIGVLGFRRLRSAQGER